MDNFHLVLEETNDVVEKISSGSPPVQFADTIVCKQPRRVTLVPLTAPTMSTVGDSTAADHGSIMSNSSVLDAVDVQLDIVDRVQLDKRVTSSVGGSVSSDSGGNVYLPKANNTSRFNIGIFTPSPLAPGEVCTPAEFDDLGNSVPQAPGEIQTPVEFNDSGNFVPEKPKLVYTPVVEGQENLLALPVSNRITLGDQVKLNISQGGATGDQLVLNVSQKRASEDELLSTRTAVENSAIVGTALSIDNFAQAIISSALATDNSAQAIISSALATDNSAQAIISTALPTDSASLPSVVTAGDKVTTGATSLQSETVATKQPRRIAMCTLARFNEKS